MRRKRARGEPLRSRAGKFAAFALALVAMGYICARLIVLLADVRPYLGWYWLGAVAIGVVVAVAVPWALFRGAVGPAPWMKWLLAGYLMALMGGMRYYLVLRFTPPGTIPAVLPPPSPGLLVEIAGLSVEAVTFAVFTLLILAAMAEVIAPGLVRRRLEAWSKTGAKAAARHPGPFDERFPARLWLEAPGGPGGRWVPGAISVRPGSLRWEPAAGVRAVSVDLGTATIVPDRAEGDPKSAGALTVDTPDGRIHLEFDAETFTLLQRLASELADRAQGQASAAER